MCSQAAGNVQRSRGREGNRNERVNLGGGGGGTKVEVESPRLRKRRKNDAGKEHLKRKGITGKLYLVYCVSLGETLCVRRWSSEMRKTAEERARDRWSLWGECSWGRRAKRQRGGYYRPCSAWQDTMTQ